MTPPISAGKVHVRHAWIRADRGAGLGAIRTGWTKHRRRTGDNWLWQDVSSQVEVTEMIIGAVYCNNVQMGDDTGRASAGRVSIDSMRSRCMHSGGCSGGIDVAVVATMTEGRPRPRRRAAGLHRID